MSGEYIYYSDGFFGFGPPGTFRPFGLMHIVPVLVCALLVVLTWRKRERIRSWKHESRLRYVMSFLMFLSEFSFFIWLLYVGDTTGDYLMIAKLPLHLCDWGIICCMYMVLCRNRSMFGFNFFITLSGAVIACAVPWMVLDDSGPAYFRYYQFYVEHLVPIFTVFYMMIVHGLRPKYTDIWVTIGVMLVMFVPSLILNEAFPGSDYLYLKMELPFSLPWPDGQYTRAALYAVIVISAFHLIWFAYRTLYKNYRKRAIKI